MKQLFFLIFMLAAIQGQATVVNFIVANVGQYSISKIDVQRMTEFLEVSRSSNSDAFTELITLYSVFCSIEGDDQILFKDKEVDTILKALTNTNNTMDPMAKDRFQIYNEYPDEYRMELKKNQIIRALAYYKPEIKSCIDEKIPESQVKDYYLTNQKMFKTIPQLDMFVVSVPQPADITLEKLTEIENALTEMTNALRKSDDISPLLEKYKNVLNLEPYSGRTGLKPINEIYKAGCPEELINFALMPSIPIRRGPPIIIKNGSIIGYEKFVFKSSPKIIHYFIIKLINRKYDQQIPFEEVKSVIEANLKEERLRAALQKYIVAKINRREIIVTIIDKSYEGEYNEFLRR